MRRRGACTSKIKPRVRAEWVVVREESCILDSCCLSPIRSKSVLEESRVRRFAVIQEDCVVEHLASE